MAEEVAAPEVKATPEVISLKTVRQEVTAQLDTSHIDVRSAIVAKMRAEKVEQLTTATAKVIEKIEAADKEFRKIKPAPLGFSLDGKPIGEPVFSKEQTEQAKKLTEQLTKLNGALEKALTTGDFSKVQELAN